MNEHLTELSRFELMITLNRLLILNKNSVEHKFKFCKQEMLNYIIEGDVCHKELANIS